MHQSFSIKGSVSSTLAKSVAICLLLLIMGMCLFRFNVTGARAMASGSDIAAHITLSAVSGPPTSNIRVNGKGFDSNTSVVLKFDATVLATVTTTGTGIFSYQIVVPASALPGQHVVKAIEQTMNVKAQASFLVRTNWNQFNYLNTRFNPYENILNAQNVSGLVPLWSDSVAESIFTSAAVVNGIVYVNDFNGGMDAYNATTGTLVWKSTAASFNLFTNSSPAVANGMVYIGGNTDGKLYAFDAATGALLWTYTTGNGIMSSPTVAYGIVYFGSNDRKVYALNAKTGKLLWSYATGYFVVTSPVVSNGIVYVGSNDGKLYAFQATTGVPLWIIPISGKASIIAPVVDHGVLYVASSYQRLLAFNANTGILRWTATGGTPAADSPAIANGVVYVTGGTRSTSEVFAYNSSTGALLWTYTDPDHAGLTPSPAVANGVVYLSSPYGKIYALDATNGSLLWTFYPPYGEVEASPTIANGVLYIGALNGELYAFHVPGTGV